MIGIQFGVYEAMKKVMLQRSVTKDKYSPRKNNSNDMINKASMPMYGAQGAIEEAAMETAASQGTSFPAPHFLNYVPTASKKDLQSIFRFRFRD